MNSDSLGSAGIKEHGAVAPGDGMSWGPRGEVGSGGSTAALQLNTYDVHAVSDLYNTKFISM